MSADSEAGPSSASPAPQTPSVAADTALPAPLRSDPIIVHSPYDEPEIYTFPTSDPDFEFVLGLDTNDEYDYQAPNSPFTPTPFSKTLVGLAELGIWSPTLPVVDNSARQGMFRSTFQPFDLSNDTPTAVAGPSRTRPETPPREQEEEQPRTTSRFDFARQALPQQAPQSPYSTSRGQSPFAIRRSHLENDWAPPTPLGILNGGRTMQQQHQQFEEQLVAQRQQSQHTGDSRASAFAQQVASFVGSYGSSTGQDWGQGQGQQEHVGSPGVRIDGRMSGLSMGRPRDDYDSGT
jgi:CCR4-NOT transcription complex subunit 4